MITYKTVGRAAVWVPGRRPAVPCSATYHGYTCTRPKGHGLRHANIRWWARHGAGAVRAVWRAT